MCIIIILSTVSEIGVVTKFSTEFVNYKTFHICERIYRQIRGINADDLKGDLTPYILKPQIQVLKDAKNAKIMRLLCAAPYCCYCCMCLTLAIMMLLAVCCKSRVFESTL